MSKHEKEKMKVLFVNCCLRGEQSRTLRLCRDYLDKFMSAMSEKGVAWEIEEINLAEEEIAAADLELEEKLGSLVKARNFDDEVFRYAKQLMAAEHIVIGAPYWDLQFPAKLKLYLERCSVSGLSFIYSEEGIPHGQCKAESLTYITTSGGYIGEQNYGYEYVKGLFGSLLGVKSCEFVSAQALDIIGNDVEKILTEAEEKITALVEKF